MLKVVKITASLLLTFTAAAIGSLATVVNIPTWYAGLEKPFFNPPNWIFGPVWTLLYTLMGISFYLVWNARPAKNKKQALLIYGLQLALNTLWSLVFFGLHSPWAGVIVILLLLASIIITVRLFWPISKTAAYLLIPYLAWVSFATLLTVWIAFNN